MRGGDRHTRHGGKVDMHSVIKALAEAAGADLCGHVHPTLSMPCQRTDQHAGAHMARHGAGGFTWARTIDELEKVEAGLRGRIDELTEEVAKTYEERDEWIERCATLEREVARLGDGRVSATPLRPADRVEEFISRPLPPTLTGYCARCAQCGHVRASTNHTGFDAHDFVHPLLDELRSMTPAELGQALKILARGDEDPDAV